jgi:hypothetical protein
VALVDVLGSRRAFLRRHVTRAAREPASEQRQTISVGARTSSVLGGRERCLPEIERGRRRWTGRRETAKQGFGRGFRRK